MKIYTETEALEEIFKNVEGGPYKKEYFKVLRSRHKKGKLSDKRIAQLLSQFGFKIHVDRIYKKINE